MAVEELQKSDVMQHLLDALDQQQDIGHYGRLVFTMIARHFLSEEEVKQYLLHDPACDEAGKDYNPPKRDRILEWQSQQDFPICPNPDDPDACNVYRDLQFPDHVYEHISSYYEQKS
jgi:hypothetical protein